MKVRNKSFNRLQIFHCVLTLSDIMKLDFQHYHIHSTPSSIVHDIISGADLERVNWGGGAYSYIKVPPN